MKRFALTLRGAMCVQMVQVAWGIEHGVRGMHQGTVGAREEGEGVGVARHG